LFSYIEGKIGYESEEEELEIVAYLNEDVQEKVSFCLVGMDSKNLQCPSNASDDAFGMEYEERS
jgi:hypothetical protein